MPLQRTIITAVLVFLASSGLATAQSTAPACYEEIPKEERVGVLSLEVEEGVYFYIPQSPDEADKLGFWEETNKRGSLQTEICYRGIVRVYSPDAYRGMAMP